MPKSTNGAAELHPTPQFRRDGWKDVGGVWGFAFDPDDRGLEERWFDRDDVFGLRINVPYPPESRLSGVHDTTPHRTIWYRREFEREDVPAGERLLLHFGAVDYRASVWVNGRLAAEHRGGHTPFSAEIAHLLTDHGPQVITVRAEDDPTDLQQPRGKQYWRERPAYIWYHRTTGIWQPVWLERVAAVALSELRWTPDWDLAGVQLVLRLNRAVPPGWKARIRLVGGEPAETLIDQLSAIEGREFRCDLQFNINSARDRRETATRRNRHNHARSPQ